eukprot:1974766-Pleurochrysis_carterae.AAC.4
MLSRPIRTTDEATAETAKVRGFRSSRPPPSRLARVPTIWITPTTRLIRRRLARGPPPHRQTDADATSALSQDGGALWRQDGNAHERAGDPDANRGDNRRGQDVAHEHGHRDGEASVQLRAALSKRQTRLPRATRTRTQDGRKTGAGKHLNSGRSCSRSRRCRGRPEAGAKRLAHSTSEMATEYQTLGSKSPLCTIDAIGMWSQHNERADVTESGWRTWPRCEAWPGGAVRACSHEITLPYAGVIHAAAAMRTGRSTCARTRSEACPQRKRTHKTAMRMQKVPGARRRQQRVRKRRSASAHCRCEV